MNVVQEKLVETGQQGELGNAAILDRFLAFKPLVVALGYLAAITLAELLTTLTEPRVGLVLHSTILIILVLHAALTWDRPIHGLLITLAFGPLIRLISLSLPLFPFPLIFWYLLTSVPLFAAAVLTAQQLNLSWDRLGVNARKPHIQFLVALTGFSFGYIEYQILQPEALAESFTWQALWMPALILLISTGFFEEVVFRGLMQTTALRVLGRFGLPFVAMVFAVLHIGYRSVSDVVFVFLVGVFFGWVVYKTGSLLGVTLAHGLTNIVLFLVMPFVAAAI